MRDNWQILTFVGGLAVLGGELRYRVYAMEDDQTSVQAQVRTVEDKVDDIQKDVTATKEAVGTLKDEQKTIKEDIKKILSAVGRP